MILPEDAQERYSLYVGLSQDCLRSSEGRRRFYTKLRHYYMNGKDERSNVACTFNNLYPHLDNLASLLFQPGNVRFFGSLPPWTPDHEYERLDRVVKAVHKYWHDAAFDIVFYDALRNALIDDCCFIKLIVDEDEHVHPYLVKSEAIGVLNETVAMLSRQDAVVHRYSITRSAFERLISAHPKRDEIVAAIASRQEDQEQRAGNVTELLISKTQPNIEGNAILPWYYTPMAPAEVAEPVIDIRELYVWDDRLRDYRMVTIAEPGVVVFDRPLGEVFLTGELPFVQLCPNPRMDYFFGESELHRLIPLQDKLNERLADMYYLLAKQARPPVAGAGFSGPPDEVESALTSPGGFTLTDNENFNVQQLATQVPPDMFADVRNILEMFEIVSGLGSVAQGRPAHGTRSEGQLSAIVKLATTRAQLRESIIEDTLDSLATLLYKTLRVKSSQMLRDDRGQQFALASASPELRIRVDAHTASPIFSQDNRELAFALLKAGAIDDAMLVELVAPPMQDIIEYRLRTRPPSANFTPMIAKGKNR